ncbi:MAG: cation-translocating P-type ATPase, partial [Oscillospiraceae bacterium]|nr:cation-translocating P-type ATPase [Oscillospiraceae bacterium]
TARVLYNNTESTVSAECVKVGDTLRVLPGETVPVDGIILSGQTSVNQAVMTGESLPVDKGSGDAVCSGTVNQFGAFEMRATKVGEDSSIQRMIRLVQSADAGKAKIVGLADRWATWIVVIALVSAALTWLVSGEIIRAVTILVVFCPCALVLATPTAIMAAIGNATKHGFLIREGDALERLAKVSKIAFDKTGTLTYGTPQVVAVCTLDEAISHDALYSLAASVERLSEHPLGKAVVHCYKQAYQAPIVDAEQFTMIPGRGVTAIFNGQPVYAGNLKLLSDNEIISLDDTPADADIYLQQGCTIIYIALAKKLIGFLALSDTLRSESATMICGLAKLGVQPVLLTGDHKNAAETIAAQLQIHEVYAGCLPEDKLNFIEQCQQQDVTVCMIGDGINDAPALKKATVGIAMGGVGSDIAVDAADIALVDDEVRELPHLFALSKHMMTTIKYNLAFSMGLNFLAIVLAITGVLNPVFGALVHNAGSVMVIINSALLLKWKK